MAYIKLEDITVTDSSNNFTSLLNLFMSDLQSITHPSRDTKHREMCCDVYTTTKIEFLNILNLKYNELVKDQHTLIHAMSYPMWIEILQAGLERTNGLSYFEWLLRNNDPSIRWHGLQIIMAALTRLNTEINIPEVLKYPFLFDQLKSLILSSISDENLKINLFINWFCEEQNLTGPASNYFAPTWRPIPTPSYDDPNFPWFSQHLGVEERSTLHKRFQSIHKSVFNFKHTNGSIAKRSPRTTDSSSPDTSVESRTMSIFNNDDCPNYQESTFTQGQNFKNN
ncbi:MAG: hypothetical protein P1U74_08135 [Legionellaceae bacterium]|nr:hypothetical protein [Legionellaceae bacterium]